MRIEPTVGRTIHYHPAADHPDAGQLLTAFICKVNADGTVNLAIFDSCGHQFSRQRVPLMQDDVVPLDAGSQYCRWMPYQLGQAAKTEQVISQHANVILHNPEQHQLDERGVPIAEIPCRPAGGANPLDHYTESVNVPVLGAGMEMIGDRPASEATRLGGE
jgi:hypothetical protein